MNVVVRNTFLHLSNDFESADVVSVGRSSSAPPTSRKDKWGDDHCDAASVTTRSKTARSSTSSCVEIDESASLSATDQHQDALPHSYSSHADDHVVAEAHPSSQAKVSSTEAQQHIDDLTQAVLGIWSKMKSAEATKSLNVDCSGSCSSHGGVNMFAGPSFAWVPVPVMQGQPPSQCNDILMASGGSVVQVQPSTGPRRTPLRTTLTDGKLPCFVPCCKASGDSNDVLSSFKQLLKLAHGVADAQIESGKAGTLTTIAITSDASVASVSEIIAKAKLLLLESAANSQSVYVMGYEAEPFKDKSRSECVAMLAFMPVEWQRAACWDIYQKGKCHRGKACKWQHPGKRQLQPIRIVVS